MKNIFSSFFSSLVSLIREAVKTVVGIYRISESRGKRHHPKYY
ncbi:hypothetical protein [Chryseobacterium sp. ISL-6]|nr:hypothetical protein [Chryseobacterium sp. ISL-6]